MKLRAIIAVSALFVTLTVAFAHDTKPRHGGRVFEAGVIDIELVIKDNTIDVYVMDHAGNSVSANGYKGVAILSLAGKSHRVVLMPVGGNKLTGMAAEMLTSPLQGAVVLTGPGGTTSQARFN